MPPKPACPNRIRHLVVVLILCLQAGAIAGATFFPALRFLAWAPFHEPAACQIQVLIEGHELNDELVARRYGLPQIHRKPGSAEDWQLNDIRNLIEVVEAYESTTGRRDRAQVQIEFRRNRGTPEVWRWPPAP